MEEHVCVPCLVFLFTFPCHSYLCGIFWPVASSNSDSTHISRALAHYSKSSAHTHTHTRLYKTNTGTETATQLHACQAWYNTLHNSGERYTLNIIRIDRPLNQMWAKNQHHTTIWLVRCAKCKNDGIWNELPPARNRPTTARIRVGRSISCRRLLILCSFTQELFSNMCRIAVMVFASILGFRFWRVFAVATRAPSPNGHHGYGFSTPKKKKSLAVSPVPGCVVYMRAMWMCAGRWTFEQFYHTHTPAMRQSDDRQSL